MVVLTSTLMAGDLTTLGGKKYKNFAVVGVEADGISISHADGIAKIPFTDLSEELRRKYGYDPAVVAAAAKQRAEAAAKLESERTKAAEAAMKQRTEAAAKQAKDAEDAAAAKAVGAAAQEKALREQEILREQLKKHQKIWVRVDRVLPNGVLGGEMKMQGRITYPTPTNKTIFVQGLGNIAEGNKAELTAYPDGIITVEGRALEKWIFVKELHRW